MDTKNNSTSSLALFSFIGGALVGVLAVALTTPKTGPDMRRTLKGMGRRAKDRVDELGGQFEAVLNETFSRTEQSLADIKRAVQEATEDLKRGLREAGLDLKGGVSEATTATPAAASTETRDEVPST